MPRGLAPWWFTKHITMKKMKTKNSLVLCLLLSMAFSSCMGEVKEKFTKAKEGVSNATTFVKEARKVEGKIEQLKNATPIPNEQLKKWLPKRLGNLDRTGFKVGQGGLYQVNSIEGDYKNTGEKQKFNVLVIDGAGPTASMMTAGYGMIGNIEMETEDENKHQKTVTVDGIKAKQTYKKKTNNTQLMFAYKERFLVTINTTDMNVEQTWELTQALNFDALVAMAK